MGSSTPAQRASRSAPLLFEVPWRRRVDEDRYRQGVDVVEQIADALAADPPAWTPSGVSDDTRRQWQASLAAGDAGIAIFYAFAHRLLPDRGFAELARKRLMRAVAAAQSGGLSPGLFLGTSGVAWAYELLREPLALGTDDPFARFDEELVASLMRGPWRRDYDLASGLVGFGVYGLARCPRPSALQLVGLVVDHLDELAVYRREGLAWHTRPGLLEPQQREDAPLGYINLGMAHGIAGAIGFLGQARVFGVRVAKARALVEGAVRFLLHHRQDNRDACYGEWLTTTTTGETPMPPGRSAWCYGDPGIACALVIAARSVGSVRIKHAAIALAQGAGRRRPEHTGVVDAGLCHGAFGLAQIFCRLGTTLNEDTLIGPALAWFDEGMRQRQPHRAVAGFPMVAGDIAPGWHADPGLLGGAAGIGLCVLGFLLDEPPDWDRFLLLSETLDVKRVQALREERRRTAPRRAQAPAPLSLALPETVFVRAPERGIDDVLALSEGLSVARATDEAACAEALAHDHRLITRRLLAWADTPEVAAALHVASPTLLGSLDALRQQGQSERGRKVARSLLRYYYRAATRATPFGLFAATAVARVTDRSSTCLDGQRHRRTRVDMAVLTAIADRAVADPALRAALCFVPNPSAYRIGAGLRYIERTPVAGELHYRLVAVELSDYLECALQAAAHGARPAELAAALLACDPALDGTAAAGYIDTLIDNQVLVATAQPALTASSIAATLRGALPEGSLEQRVLTETQALLDRLDEDTASAQTAAPADYQAATTLLHTVVADLDAGKALQVDLVRSAPELTVSTRIIEALGRGAVLLHALAATGTQSRAMDEFAGAFSDRYGDAEVPLVEVLDEEAGIGYRRRNALGATDAPLLHGLPLRARFQGEEFHGYPRRERFLQWKLSELAAHGGMELTLTEAEIASVRHPEAPPLCEAFAVLAVLCAPSAIALDDGDHQLWIQMVTGPSGINLISRFCDVHPSIRAAVDAHIHAEERLRPEVAYAEVVHLPEGRIGNILARPVLRGYEIPFLAASGADPQAQLPITDLDVSVVGGRVVLRSRRLGREVMPRLSSAHLYNQPDSVRLYEFLCALQQQGNAGGLAFSWGALAARPFLPRVRCGRFLFSPARWMVSILELRPILDEPEARRFLKVQSWRRARRMPRFVQLAEGDNTLLCDFENPLSVDSWLALAARRPMMELWELLPGLENQCLERGGQRLVHELVVPFVQTTAPALATQTVPIAVRPTHAARSFPPGSEWLFAKVYTGAATADDVLTEIVAPVQEAMRLRGVSDRWFFIRYGDPEWHLRLRWHGEGDRLLRELWQTLRQELSPALECGLVADVALETYVREWQRYGGDEGIQIAEALFAYDSQAALALLAPLRGAHHGGWRWRLALLGVHRWLDDLGIALDERPALLQASRGVFGAGYALAASDLEHAVSLRFRQERLVLEELLWAGPPAEWAPCAAILAQRSEHMAPALDRLKALARRGQLLVSWPELARSYVHMWLNRLLRTEHNAQEVILYDFLSRMYRSRHVRTTH